VSKEKVMGENSNCPRIWFRLSVAIIAVTTLAAASLVFANQKESAPGSFVDVEGGKIYYEECGAALEAVLLIHDGVVNSAVWDDVWPAFCKNFHSIRYDRRGYGRSPAATTWYTETDDIWALLHHLKIHRTMIVGSSHGGELSIEFTIAHPELVAERFWWAPSCMATRIRTI